MKKHELLNPAFWIMVATIVVVAISIPEIYEGYKRLSAREWLIALLMMAGVAVACFLIVKWSSWYSKKYGISKARKENQDFPENP